MLRRQISRLGALALGTLGLVAVAAPAHAATPPLCSVSGGVLTVDLYAPDDPLGAPVILYAVVGSALDESGDRIVTVQTGMTSPANVTPQVCQSGGVDILTSSLTSVVVQRDHSSGKAWWLYYTDLTINLSGRFLADEATATSGVPLAVKVWPDDLLSLIDTSWHPANWTGLAALVGSHQSPLDLDNDGTAELVIDNSDNATSASESSNHTFLGLNLGTGTGADTVDLSASAFPTHSRVIVDTGPGDDKIDGSSTPSDFQTGLVMHGWTGNDTLTGSSQSDIIDGSLGDDVIDGGADQDAITPGEGADTVDSGADPDHITIVPDGSPDKITANTEQDSLTILSTGNASVTANGVADDETTSDSDNYGAFASITTGFGNDYVDASVPGGSLVDTGDGNDTVVVGSGHDVLAGGAGDNTVDFSRQSVGVTYNSGPGLATIGDHTAFMSDFGDIIGSSHDDTLTSAVADAVVRPGAGDDKVMSDVPVRFVADALPDGIDAVTCPAGSVIDYGLRTSGVALSSDGDANDGAPGEGDNLDCVAGPDLIGGAGADTLVGTSYADLLIGNEGADVLRGRGGNDVLDGGTGTNQLFGGSGADLLTADTGADSLYGGDGDDRLSAGDGNDVLDGGLGDDDEYGEFGNDTFVQGSTPGANGSDFLSGSGGIDTVSYLGRSAGVTISNDGTYNDGAAGEADSISTSVEKLIGTNAADTITGGLLADWLYGYGGADLVHGNAGNDVIDGGTAADKLYGDAGNDSLYAKDGTKDTVTGGTGTDKARRDAIDLLSSIEGSL